jgi:hypothetical protein
MIPAIEARGKTRIGRKNQAGKKLKALREKSWLTVWVVSVSVL